MSRPLRILIWAGRVPLFALALASFAGTVSFRGAQILFRRALAGPVRRR